jgi:membrane-associated phospholipid phosphatase
MNIHLREYSDSARDVMTGFVLRHRCFSVWVAGVLLYGADFLIKVFPPWREPWNVEIGLDHHIPFLPLWAYVYLPAWLVFILGAGGWYIWENRRHWDRVRALLFAAVIMQVGGWFFHTVFPTYMPRPELGPDAGGPAYWLILKIYATDPPTHVLPSLHVASVLVAAMFFAARRERGRVIIGAVFVLLISLSVVLTKQHGVIDIAAGLAWGYVAVRAGDRASGWLEPSGLTPTVGERLVAEAGRRDRQEVVATG